MIFVLLDAEAKKSDFLFYSNVSANVDVVSLSVSGNFVQSHDSGNYVPKNFSLAPLASDGMLPIP